MKLDSLRLYVYGTVRAPGLMMARKKYLLLVSHMRSRSSLLGHILGDHPAIAGYSEMHIAYSAPRRLMRLRYRLFEEGDYRDDCTYLFDKVLHNELTLGADVLNHPDVHLLFMVRSPAQTIPSVISMGRRFPEVAWHRDVDTVIRYYMDRLTAIVECTRLLRHDRCAFVDSDRLVNDTDSTLAGLDRWLGLASPLSPRYKARANTGRLGYGDPSNTLLEGQVVSRAGRYEDIRVPEADMAEADKTYRKTCSLLTTRMHSI